MPDKKYPPIITILVLIVVSLACNQVTGLLPTATLQPTPIPGWEKFEGAGAELWLPESFEGGDLANDLDVIVNKLKSLGPDFEKTANTIEQNPSAVAIWAFDSNVGSSGSLTNMNVVKERVISAITLDTYMDATAKRLPASFEVTDRRKVRLEHYEAGQLVVQVELPSTKLKELLYVIKDKNIVWVITYATGMDEFEERLPTFEQSANTFKIQP